MDGVVPVNENFDERLVSQEKEEEEHYAFKDEKEIKRKSVIMAAVLIAGLARFETEIADELGDFS